MAKKWRPQPLPADEEELLIEIGEADHLFADNADGRIVLLERLKEKGLVFWFSREAPGGGKQRAQAWAVTSEGFFTFKYFLNHPESRAKKGSRK
jgi:hypothetical protein